MAKQVIAYAAEDGTRFDTEAAAAEHDLDRVLTNLSGDAAINDLVAFISTNAEVILPYLKALVDGRTRDLNPQAAQVVARQPAAATQVQQAPQVRTKLPTAEEMRGLPSGGGVIRGASTGWSVMSENGQWFCTNGVEKSGPFNKRSDAVAHFRSKAAGIGA